MLNNFSTLFGKSHFVVIIKADMFSVTETPVKICCFATVMGRLIREIELLFVRPNIVCIWRVLRVTQLLKFVI